MIFKRKIRIKFYSLQLFFGALFNIKYSILAVHLLPELTKRWHLSSLAFKCITINKFNKELIFLNCLLHCQDLKLNSNGIIIRITCSIAIDYLTNYVTDVDLGK